MFKEIEGILINTDTITFIKKPYQGRSQCYFIGGDSLSVSEDLYLSLLPEEIEVISNEGC